jgi:hypothetical protein
MKLILGDGMYGRFGRCIMTFFGRFWQKTADFSIFLQILGRAGGGSEKCFELAADERGWKELKTAKYYIFNAKTQRKEPKTA